MDKKALIERTKNYSKMKIDVNGAVNNVCADIEYARKFPEDAEPVYTFSIREIARLYALGREAWLKGDFETVADLFGVLV